MAIINSRQIPGLATTINSPVSPTKQNKALNSDQYALSLLHVLPSSLTFKTKLEISHQHQRRRVHISNLNFQQTYALAIMLPAIYLKTKRYQFRSHV